MNKHQIIESSKVSIPAMTSKMYAWGTVTWAYPRSKTASLTLFKLSVLGIKIAEEMREWLPSEQIYALEVLNQGQTRNTGWWTKRVCLPSPKLSCWNLTPQCDVMRTGGLWEVTEPWAGALRMGLRRDALTLCPLHVGYKKLSVCNQEADSQDTGSASTVILDFAASRTMRNDYLSFNPLVLWYSIIAI